MPETRAMRKAMTEVKEGDNHIQGQPSSHSLDVVRSTMAPQDVSSNPSTSGRGEIQVSRSRPMDEIYGEIIAQIRRKPEDTISASYNRVIDGLSGSDKQYYINTINAAPDIIRQVYSMLMEKIQENPDMSVKDAHHQVYRESLTTQERKDYSNLKAYWDARNQKQ